MGALEGYGSRRPSVCEQQEARAGWEPWPALVAGVHKEERERKQQALDGLACTPRREVPELSAAPTQEFWRKFPLHSPCETINSSV